MWTPAVLQSSELRCLVVASWKLRFERPGRNDAIDLCPSLEIRAFKVYERGRYVTDCVNTTAILVPLLPENCTPMAACRHRDCAGVYIVGRLGTWQ